MKDLTGIPVTVGLGTRASTCSRRVANVARPFEIRFWRTLAASLKAHLVCGAKQIRLDLTLEWIDEDVLAFAPVAATNLIQRSKRPSLGDNKASCLGIIVYD